MGGSSGWSWGVVAGEVEAVGPDTILTNDLGNQPPTLFSSPYHHWSWENTWKEKLHTPTTQQICTNYLIKLPNIFINNIHQQVHFCNNLTQEYVLNVTSVRREQTFFGQDEILINYEHLMLYSQQLTIHTCNTTLIL